MFFVKWDSTKIPPRSATLFGRKDFRRRNGDTAALAQEGGGKPLTGMVRVMPDGSISLRVKENVPRSAENPDGQRVRDVPVKDKTKLVKLIDNGGMRFKRGKNADLRSQIDAVLNTDRKAGEVSKRRTVVKMSRVPASLIRLGLPDAEIETRADIVRKIHTQHGLSAAQIADIPARIDSPAAVLKDGKDFIVLTDLEAKTKHGENKPVMVLLRPWRNADGSIVFLASAYPREAANENKYINIAQVRGNTLFVDKNKIAAIGLEERTISTLNTPTSHGVSTDSISQTGTEGNGVTPAEDAAYMDAVKRGDMETAQRMVREAAKSQGYTIKVFHGTDARFTVFDNSIYNGSRQIGAEEGFFFAPTEKQAARFATRGKSVYIPDWDELLKDKPFKNQKDYEDFIRALRMDENWKGPSREEIKAKLGIKSDDEFFAKRDAMFDIEAALRRGRESVEESNKPNVMRVLLRDADWDTVAGELVGVEERRAGYLASRKAMGYTGVKITNADTGGYYGDEYVVFKPNDIKSADAVTYDDAGEVIPLSQRFNPEKADLRFKKTLSLEEERDVADHILTEEPIVSNGRLLAMPPAEQRAATKRIYDGYKSRSPIRTLDGRDVNLTTRGFKEIKQHSADPHTLALVEVLPGVISSMHYIGDGDVKPTDKDVKAYHLYARRVNLGDGEMVARVVVREDVNGDIFYDEESTSLETLKEITRQATRNPNARPDGQSPYAPHSLSDFFHRVNSGRETPRGVQKAAGVEYPDAGREISGLRFKVGGVYTGSAADYANRSRQGGVDDGPKLHNIGDMFFVYGYGYEGTTLRKIAERNNKGKKWKYLYKQTFFTNRAKGDESHILETHGEVTAEQMRWVADEMDRSFTDNGEKWTANGNRLVRTDEKGDSSFGPFTGDRLYSFVRGQIQKRQGNNLQDTARLTSELFARADIDGIKTPSLIYGKTSADDKTGWNYISFRDDNIRVDHKWTDGQMRFKRSAAELQRDYDEVVARYTNADGTKKRGWMRAPNGQPTKLTERQWVQVRTPAFKEWFGDWESSARRLLLDAAKVARIAQGVFKKIGDKSIQQRASEMLKDPVVHKTEIGDITIDKRSAHDSLAHRYSQKKLDALVTIQQDFANAVYLGSERDFDGKDITNHYFAYPIDYGEDGERNLVFCRAREDKNANRLYVHEVFLESELKNNGDALQAAAASSTRDASRTDASPSASPRGIALARIILQRLFADNSTFRVVDENGEPLVVYRRDNEAFNVFDVNKTQQNDAGWLGKGFYFYGDRREAESATGYGKNLREFYLKAENPYYITPEEYNRLVEADDPHVSAEFAESLREEGYDSVYWNGDGRKEWMVLEPTQIKSATDNTGAFDGAESDIRFKRGANERAADDTSVWFGAGASMAAHGFDIHTAKELGLNITDKDTVAAANELAADVRRMAEIETFALTNNRPLAAEEVVALAILTRNLNIDLGRINKMMAESANAAAFQAEKELVETRLNKAQEALNKAGTHTGQSMQSLKIGILPVDIIIWRKNDLKNGLVARSTYACKMRDN